MSSGTPGTGDLTLSIVAAQIFNLNLYTIVSHGNACNFNLAKALIIKYKLQTDRNLT